MKQNNEIYKYLFESAVEGLVVTNQRGEIVLVNPRLEQLFGYKKEELIGKTIEILLPQKFRHSHVAQRDKYIEKPKNRSMGTGIDLCGCKKDGSEFSVEISLNYFKNEGETFVMGLITDISERKKMEDELKHLNQHHSWYHLYAAIHQQRFVQSQLGLDELRILHQQRQLHFLELCPLLHQSHDRSMTVARL